MYFIAESKEVGKADEALSREKSVYLRIFAEDNLNCSFL